MPEQTGMRISVREYFRNSFIFITGVTGFVGKVLLAKILRDCGDEIAGAYVLIRPKAARSPSRPGLNVHERLEKVFKDAIFQKTVREKPDILRKVVPVEGDVTLKNLGISAKDRAILCEKVSIVFHLAASVKFQERLILALNINSRGAERMLQLAQEMPRLNAFVYVSTAYSNFGRIEIDEVVYPFPSNPKSFLAHAEWLDEMGILDSLTTKLVGSSKYTYFFAKYLSENLVEQTALDKNLPVCIVRPAIISPILRDPIGLEGWVDNIMGFNGISCELGHGFVYTIPSDATYNVDLIPVDFVANVIILAAWDLATRGSPATVNSTSDRTRIVPVYNASPDPANIKTYREAMGKVAEACMKTPFEQVLRPPSARMTTNLFWFWLSNFVAIGLPCFFLDFITRIQGRKGYMSLKYKAVYNALEVLSPIGLTNFKFSRKNVAALEAKLSPEDKPMFDLNIRDFSWPDYLEKVVLGLRRYYEIKDDSSIPKSRKNLKRVIYIWRGITFFLGLALLCLMTIPVFLVLQ